MHLTKCDYVIDENFHLSLELHEFNEFECTFNAATDKNKPECPISNKIYENGYPMDFENFNTGCHVESSVID